MCPLVRPGPVIHALVARAEPSELPTLAGELALALANVLSRTAAAAAPTSTPSPPEGVANLLLTVEEAAARLGVARGWLHRHSRKLPFTRKLGHRTLRFDAAGLERWLSTQRVSERAG